MALFHNSSSKKEQQEQAENKKQEQKQTKKKEKTEETEGKEHVCKQIPQCYKVEVQESEGNIVIYEKDATANEKTSAAGETE